MVRVIWTSKRGPVTRAAARARTFLDEHPEIAEEIEQGAYAASEIAAEPAASIVREREAA